MVQLFPLRGGLRLIFCSQQFNSHINTSSQVAVQDFFLSNQSCTGLKRFREAALVLEEGLRVDPFDKAIKHHLETASNGIMRDLLEGAHQLGMSPDIVCKYIFSR